MKYDYLIVGAGLFGSIVAREMTNRGKKCLVIDKRANVGGNIYTEKVENINVHKYGAHIFHTSNQRVWDYINSFEKLEDYTHEVLAYYKGKYYNLPFNMNTFKAIWGVETAEEAKAIIEEQKKAQGVEEPTNLEEQAINLVGKDVYEILVKGYTEKQWGKDCKELPPFIIKRLPVRYEYNNNYFNDTYQGMPKDGYTSIIEKMLEGIEVKVNTEYKDFIQSSTDEFVKTVYTGAIDEFFDYKLGKLEYRTVGFDTQILDEESYQKAAVVNYTEREVPYTRIIEHKKFDNAKSNKTVISKEFSKSWSEGDEPYYPVNNDRNNELYNKYKELAKERLDVDFGGRLGEYKYYDMDKVILSALEYCDNH